MSDKLEHFDGCYQHSGAALPWDDTCTCGASEIAALQARLAECEREKEQAERNYERARDSVLEAASHLKVCRFEVMGLTAERDTLRAQLTETQKLLEREQTIARIERKELDVLRKQHEQDSYLLSVQLAVGDKLEAENKRLASKVLHYENTVCMPDMRRKLVAGAVAAEVCPKKVGDLLAELAALRELCAAVFQSDDMHQALSELRDALGR